MYQEIDCSIKYCFSKLPFHLTNLIYHAEIEFLDEVEIEQMYANYPDIPEVVIAYHEYHFELSDQNTLGQKLAELKDKHPDHLGVRCCYIFNHFDLNDIDQFADIFFILEKEISAIFKSEPYDQVVGEVAYRQLLFILLRLYYKNQDTNRWNRVYDLIRAYHSPSFAIDSAFYIKNVDYPFDPTDFFSNSTFLSWVDGNLAILIDMGPNKEPHYSEAHHILNTSLSEFSDQQVAEFNIERDVQAVYEDILWALSQGFHRYLQHEGDTTLDFFLNTLFWAAQHNVYQYVPIFFELLSYLDEEIEDELFGDIQYRLLQPTLCKLLKHNQDQLFEFIGSLEGGNNFIKSTIPSILVSCYYENPENKSIINLIEDIYNYLLESDVNALGWLISSMVDFDYPKAVERMKSAFEKKLIQEETHGTLEENLSTDYSYERKFRYTSKHNMGHYRDHLRSIFKKMHPGTFGRLNNEDFIEKCIKEKLENAENNKLDHFEDEDLFLDPFLDFDDDYFEEPFKRESPKVGRNDPCPCGSGRKYKKCCLE